MSGQIVKLIANMKQGEKVPQSTKVDKNLLQSKQKNIDNLMNEIDEGDSDSDEKKSYNNKNNNRYNSNIKNNNTDFNYDNTQGYVAQYSQRKNEDNISNNDDIDLNNLNDFGEEKDNLTPETENKPKIITRQKKAKKEESNNNSFSDNKRTGVRRTIKQKEEMQVNLSYNNTYTKGSIQREKREPINVESSDSKDNNYTYISFNKPKNRLPIEKDNSIKIFWYDAIEESFNNKPNVIFFGKIYEPQSNSFLSISIIIKDIYRTVFVLPKPEYEDQQQKVYEEFEELRKKRFNSIKEYQCKFIKKKYCFELPIDSEKEHNVMKVKYKAEYGTIPPNLNQKTFDYIFGKKSSLLENILLKLKIKGPCWLKVKNFTENNCNFLRTWSDYELSLDDFKNIEVITKINNSGAEIPIPPMKIVSISTQSIRNKNANELFCICCALKEGYHVEDVKGSNKVDDFQPLIFTRKIDSKMSIFKNGGNDDKNNLSINVDNIPDLNDVKAMRNLLKIGDVYIANDEKSLLITFITKISSYDPDIIVGHNLNNKHLDLILSRISFYKSPNWTKLSHFKRSTIPNHLRGANNSEYCRNCFSGRLLCDTFDNTKDILFKETNYDLRTICEKYLNLKNLPEIEATNVLANLSSVDDIKQILQITMDEAYYTLMVMDKFQILPLTLQLTTIAGCLWTKSLQCSRAARCEMLLLHQFYEKNYLFPDKYHRTELIEEEDKEDDDDEDEGDNENNMSRNQRRKPQYMGGLVLDPIPGLYDDIILVMDFNSLYPSIIQEYNISFETVIRKATQSFVEEANWNKNKFDKNKKKKKAKAEKKKEKSENGDNAENKDNEDKSEDEKSENPIKIEDNDEKEDEDEENITKIEINEQIRFKQPQATLPSILKYLVDERKNVRKKQKVEKDKFKHSLLEIKQKSLKISANSLYGYLGYKNSRFYAKEIAALITKTGRRILRNAANIVNKMGYKIIYGDTDSVMVNTMTQNIKEAVEIGKKIHDAISKQYNLLIIDIDGVFKSMLLLKKKKYACLKYLPPYTDQNKFERELKGVDLVRRDWSPLSKNTGIKILDIILSGKSKDEIIMGIYDELKKVSEDINNNKIELKDYAITKQLAKNIDDYHDLKALPHVQVAKRLREQGKRNFQIHSFIPYVICLYKDDENGDNEPRRSNKTIADRAYHPKEIENDPTLKIDYTWYKENQILPVVKRLVQHIQEITMNQLCESLDIEYKSHDYHEQNNEILEANNNADKRGQKIKNIKVQSGICFKCPNCNDNRNIKELRTREECIRKLSECKKCHYQMKDLEEYKKIANIIKNTAKYFIFLYYRKKSTCSICKESNNILFCRTKCSDKTCGGWMKTDYDEMCIYHELRFLNELVDVSNNSTSDKDIYLINFDKAVEKIQNYIKKINSKIAYAKVNISDLFSFIN